MADSGIVGSASLSSREWLLAQEYVADPNRHTDFFMNVRERVLGDEDPKELFDGAGFESLLIPDFSIISRELIEHLSKHPEDLHGDSTGESSRNYWRLSFGTKDTKPHSGPGVQTKESTFGWCERTQLVL